VSELERLVKESLREETAERFARRVDEQAKRLRAAIADGAFDSPGFAVGLELEAYAVNRPVDEDGCLAPLPDAAFEGGANKELGVHNVELNTDPNVFDATGLASQRESIETSADAARRAAREQGCELVFDAMWTIPPEAGSRAYLSATDDAEVTVATNMRTDPRYVAIDNDSLRGSDGSIPFEVPGAEWELPSILFESLATSIQPHLQLPTAESLPSYYNAAIRTLGPVLALSTNSPFLPPDLYTVDDPAELVEATPHELRIAAFEQSVNQTANRKVRVPRDIAATTDAVDRVVADDPIAPFLREWITEEPREGLAEEIWEFDYKRTTYWRWLRCVVGGDPVGGGDERSLRIEYRPIPTQPTVRDVVGFQALVAGLIRGLVAADHPLADLPWEAAEASFYAAVAEGIDADLAWLTADGERTTDSDVVFSELFAHARRGLTEAGLPDRAIDRYIEPIEARWEARTTPSVWKKSQVRERLRSGASFNEAMGGMQRAYIRKSLETDSFAEWL